MKNLIYGLALSVLLTACGTSSTISNNASTGGASTSTTGTSSSTGNIYNLPGASDQVVQLGGSGTSTATSVLTFSTGRTLKVKITPQPAPPLIVPGYTNYVFPYGCASVSVTVNGVTRSTQVLQVGGQAQGSTSLCASAPTYQVIDFSDLITGTGSTQVQIGNAQYDNCRNYSPRNYGCGMSAVWLNHQMAVDVAVQVDGTYLSQ